MQHHLRQPARGDEPRLEVSAHAQCRTLAERDQGRPSRGPRIFGSRGGVSGEQAVVAAMIDRVVHHADVLTLKGASYRLRNRGIDTLPSIRTQDTAH